MSKANSITLYDGPLQVDRIATGLNIPEHYVHYKLGELAAREPGDHWAEVEQSGTTTIFRLDSGELTGVVVRSKTKLRTTS